MGDRALKCVSIAAVMLFVCGVGIPQTVVINEFLASNNGGIVDEDGDRSDWIEVYNSSETPVNLEGWGISNDSAQLFRWVFPSVTLPPNEFLLVWASGKDRAFSGNARVSGLDRQVYTNISGVYVEDLLNHWSFPDYPAIQHTVNDYFESPTNISEHYGQRMHGYIVPPVTGTYRFWIASDDYGRLLLSTDDNPDNAVTIAEVPGWTNPREWNKYTEQQSAPITLQGGQFYYISALMKEHEGGDNLAVRWQLPSGVMEEPIPVSRLYRDVPSQLHTSFTLSPSGTPLYLTAPDGTVISAADPAVLPSDVSYGRISDGGDQWGFFMEPTPRKSNGDSVGYASPEHVLAPRDEKLSRSSRRTSIVISEIMYQPAPRADERVVEYIELYNTDLTAADLGGWRLTGAIDYTFPTGTTLDAGTFLVVAKVAEDIQAVYGIDNVIGGYFGSLNGDDGVVELRNRGGALLLEAAYASTAPWPAAAAGAGHSLTLGRPSYGENSLQAWRASTYKGGSPGVGDPIATDLLRHIRINEFLAHTDEPLIDYIELYNHSNLAVDLSGAFLSDKPDENRFQIPDGTVIGPGGFVVFYEDTLGFALSASGEAIYLTAPDDTRIIDAIRFGAQPNGVSMGRYPDGGEDWYFLSTLTPGAPNASLRSRDIVINEIMFNPISGLDADTYVELYNTSNQTIDLSDWRFVDGIQFVIPQGTQIPSGGYLVVAKDKLRLLSAYSHLNETNTVGDFGGQLANSGERIALAMPIIRTLEPTNYAVVDEVTYLDGGRWGRWANRDGSSLELIDPRSNNRLSANWSHSDERGKSEWTKMEYTGVLDHGQGVADALHILLPSAGICLIDNVEVFASGGSNQVPNSTFESGTTGWTFQGNHVRSGWHTQEGFDSNRSLRLESTGGGDTGANRIKINLNTTFSPGQTVTIRANVRWLAGHNDVIFRLRGNYLEAVASMPLPLNLGTPGQRNSVYVSNRGPAIDNVRHYPTLPQAGQPIMITAQACDPDGVAYVALRYRLDPASTVNTIMMRDDGQSGDVIAGDGIYTAVIPGQAAGTLIAYYIQALDSHVAAASATYPDNISDYEALVRIGEVDVDGNMLAYRMWFTQATLNEWTNREKLSNQRLPGTLVYGSRVIHNIGARYRGSPFIRPGYSSPLSGNIAAYSFHVPRDNRLLGSREFNLDGLEQPSRDDTLQREKMTFWIAEQLGVPFSHQTYLYVFINGVRRGLIYTDSQHIDSDYVKTWFPEDDSGELFKIDDWFEFDDNFGFSSVNATLQNFTTTDGAKKQARYRWNWNKRSNRGLDDDYSRLFHLVNAVNAPADTYAAETRAWVDIEQWMRVFAVRRLVGDWDGYGYERGKNTWTYKPAHDRWKMILWDLDFSLGGGSHGPTTTLFGSTNDPTIQRMYNHPLFRRAYLRAFYDAVYGCFHPDVMDPVMAARYAAFQDEGLIVAGPAGINSWVSQRRNYVIGVLNAESPDVFAVTTNSGNNFNTASPWLTLQGVAPVNAKTLTFNGRPYPVIWTSVTNWTVRIPLQAGVNTIVVQGLDSWDEPIQGAQASIAVTYTGQAADPQEHLVINEIMYNPVEPETEFVEIHNTSMTHGFDLTGHRLRGIDFDFADGTLVEPNGYAVIAKDRFAFYTAYGNTLPVVGEYNGQLHPEGERLRLVRLATESEDEIILDEVAYGVAAPWPPAANGQGASLQRIDPEANGGHPGNWAAVTEDDPAVEPTWQFVSLTGVTHPSSPSDRIYIYLQSAGEFHIDDLFLARGSVAQAGQNYIQNGGFEQPLSGTWTVSPNHAESLISTAVKRSGTGSLHVVASSGGSTQASSIWQENLSLEYGEVYTLSYWYLPNPEGAMLTVRLRYSEMAPEGIISTHSVKQETLSRLPFTPGVKNSVYTSLPPFPPLWINEVQPINTGGFADSYGQSNPWVEIYNAGDQAISLADFYLTNDHQSLAKWPFPADAEIGAGQYRVIWLDGQPEMTAANEWHANFQIDPEAGSLALSRRIDQSIVLVDWLGYGTVLPALSYGRFPDGAADAAHTFYVPTPGQPNDNTSVPLLHYWHFNTLPEGTLSSVSADFSFSSGARITYPGSGAGYMDRVNDGTSLNARMLELPGYALRVRNPSDTRQLLLELPTTGYENILLSYSVNRTSNGAEQQSVYYRLNSEGPWLLWGDAIDIAEEYQLFTFDFSTVPGVNDNPEFAVQILFGGSNASGASGNNRFDNITLEGLPLEGTNLPPQLVTSIPLTEAIADVSTSLVLSQYITDPDNDTLTFTAMADRPSVVQAAVFGGVLVLTPLYQGEAVITIIADDGFNPPLETSFRLLVYPSPQTLRLGEFRFEGWSADQPEHTFPDHMLFLQSDVSDPGLTEALEYAYFIPHDDYHADDQEVIGFPYKTTGRTRLNGLDEDGIAFINTGRGRDLGGALVALDTTGLEGVRVNWLAGTILRNVRQYAIRLQYRVGIDGPFMDVLDDGQPVEYSAQTDGDMQTLDPVDLPSEAVDQPYVQLLWRYYHVDGDSGARPQLRLDDMAVSGKAGIFEDLGLFAQWWLVTDCLLYDHCAGADLTRDGIVNLEDFAVLASSWLSL